MTIPIPPGSTVNSVFADAVAEASDRLFIDFSGERYTYGEFDVEVERLARGLHRLGVGRGDRVVTQLDNSADVVKTWFAVNRLGAIWVPINTAYKGEFLAHQVADSGARVAIVESEFVSRFAVVADRIPSLDHLIARGASQTPPTTTPPWRLSALTDHLVDEGERPQVDLDESELCGLFYTAGTTGPSKGCMVSHHYLLHVGRLIVAAGDRRPDEHLFTPLPLFHVGAVSMVMSSVQLKGSVSVAGSFSVKEFWNDVERTGARMVCVMASMIPLLAQAPETPAAVRCKGQVRVALGLPFTPELQEAWQSRFGVEVAGFNMYGLTEAATATLQEGGRGAKPGSSGRRHQWLDVRIFDEQDREVPPGDVGEIVARPLEPHVMFEGYWNRPEATLAQQRNLWFHTGDLGRFDEDGFLYFVDRRKDYLRRRGENISSFELESTFAQHPAVSEVAVHAVFSELTEDDVKVTAVLGDGAELSPEELFAWAVDRVPYFALPRYIEFRPELPKNPVGRVLKYQLRDEGCTTTTWDREAAGVTVARR